MEFRGALRPKLRVKSTRGNGLSHCDRRDLERWTDYGGPLPMSLASHLQRCDGCANYVRRVSKVHSSLTLIRTHSMPQRVLPGGNTRALRMLRRIVRASDEATRAVAGKPGLTTLQRVQLHVTRLSAGFAAAAILLVMRVGIVGGIEHVQNVGENLAESYWDNHSDPENDWLRPDRLA